MPNKKEQVWFNNERENFFNQIKGIDSMSLHIKDWIMMKKTSFPKRFHNGAPMTTLPSSAGLKTLSNKSNLAQPSIDGVNWFQRNVKDNLVLLKKRKRKKKL